MADDLLQLLHGLGPRKLISVYGRARAAAHWVHRVHVARVADGFLVLDAPALVLSFLTVVFCVFFTCPAAVGRVDGVLQNGFFMQLKRRAQRRRAS